MKNAIDWVEERKSFHWKTGMKTDDSFILDRLKRNSFDPTDEKLLNLLWLSAVAGHQQGIENAFRDVLCAPKCYG